MLVLNTQNAAKFGCDPWYYKEEFLILDFKCWNIFRCNEYCDTIKYRNKASKQHDKNIYCEKRFHKYCEFISCLCMAGWTKQ